MPFLRTLLSSKDLTVVIFIATILAIIIVPLPSGMLDLLLSISIALSVLIVLIALYIDKPTEFYAFPTILLIVTLYRLALNVATTRMILSEGYNGADSVSSIIASFGNFVVGGNYVIGVIVFTILVLVNLIVITNGSTRVTEVRARFTLDAMPGKQMAIDADLNAGLIKQEEAKARREALQQEADFYGTMDGASKFVKGDAIASIIITLVNIIGGFLIGFFQYNLSAQQSAEIFTILTIGDGLVGQIPALIIATATGIMTTRAAKGSGANFASDIVTQITSNAKILLIVGFILCLFALVPGLPLSLGFVGLFFFVIAWLSGREDTKSFFVLFEKWLNKYFDKKPIKTAKTQTSQQDGSQHSKERVVKSEEEIIKEEEASLNEALKIEVLEINLGYELIKLADIAQYGNLLERIRQVRKQIARDYGFLVPQVRIKDNLNLSPSSYNILLKGVAIGGGEVYPNKVLAMNTGLAGGDITGEEVTEPVFGLAGIWIESAQKDKASALGYVIVEPTAIITTHLTELIKEYAQEFITIDEVKMLMDKVEKIYPEVVAEARKIPISTIRKVLQALLHEKIPIKDMLTILETLIDVYPILQNDLDSIVEQVRYGLKRTITDLFMDQNDKTLKVMAFSPATDSFLLSKLKEQPANKTFLLNIKETTALSDAITTQAHNLIQKNISPVVLLVDFRYRKAIANFLEQNGINVIALSNVEIDTHAKYEVLATIDVNL
ncbi:MAG: flagellar biosynthesis protein FlhA [Helicobacter sp.]|uniref:flagellar biosynthesis protein FlhA n=1 Tax=Helicobacter sp. 10-6591 TaxID=2004998 RepID=UPI000DCCF11F|nr:flagellar biosynthesis protein FlhA [Helicobacter sp. 10-6591]MDD7566981.1 flagellar biosynthesis protein FlhA [Helicobacter sp.]MDY5741194.1 flagellar biosynthesis protein FlhA [Helicobacter sp.]RAX54793.1 flagellar biosynthesis protein FlhA [Helicobacter sp. 10-6591]